MTKQFRSEGCASYVISCAESRKALLIDPRVELLDDYREFVSSRSLKPVWVVDTQTHSDHFSASHLLARQYGAEVGMSHLTQSLRPTRRLKSGDRITVGKVSFEVLETPGVAADAISLYGGGLVFTGYTVGVGCVGRTDLPGADAGSLWDSLHRTLAKLPVSTLVYSSQQGSDILFSTIEVEMRQSADWESLDRAAFIARKLETSPPLSPTRMSEDLRLHLDFNRGASPEFAPNVGFLRPRVAAPSSMQHEPGSIGIAKYASKLKEQAPESLFIDVREPEEFQESRIPGSRNIPLSELGLHLKEFTQAKRVYLSCLAGPRSIAGARTLSYLGLKDIVVVNGGLKAWISSGFPLEKS